MIYILLLFTIVIFFITFIISQNDIMFPGCVVCIVWIFCELCVVYNIDYWGVDLSWKTVVIYLTTILLFVIMCFVGDYFGKRKKWSIVYKNKKNIVSIPKKYIVICVAFNFIVMLLVISSVWGMAGITSMGDSNAYAIAMSQYRGSDDSLPGLVKQLYKIMKCNAYIFLYVFLQKLDGKYKCRYILPGIFFCIASLSTGSRTDFLHYFIAALVVLYITMQQKRGWSVRLNLKYVVWCIAAVCLFLICFNFIKTYVGRLNVLDPIRYITSYAGGSIQLFDMYLKDPMSRSEQFGQLTFYSLWQNLQKLGLAEWKPIGLEFRASNGHLIGNLYTSIRRYYQDFGLIGNYVLQSLFALFYSYWYRCIKKDKTGMNGYSVVMYSMVVSPLFLHAIDDTLFSGFLCVNTIVLALITGVIYALLECRVKILFNSRR